MFFRRIKELEKRIESLEQELKDCKDICFKAMEQIAYLRDQDDVVRTRIYRLAKKVDSFILPNNSSHDTSTITPTR